MTNSPINFNYAFAEPHRICVCLPESSNKTLFDCTKESLMMLWSDGNTKNNPLGAYKGYGLTGKSKLLLNAMILLWRQYHGKELKDIFHH